MFIVCYSWELSSDNFESLVNTYISQYNSAIIIEFFFLISGSILCIFVIALFLYFYFKNK